MNTMKYNVIGKKLSLTGPLKKLNKKKIILLNSMYFQKRN